MMALHIPRVSIDDDIAPAWIPMTRGNPIIRCQCGALLSSRHHTVADDGTMTPSFLHPKCGFHVYLHLDHYQKATG